MFQFSSLGRWAAKVATGSLATTLFAAPVGAKNCGGNVPCVCGDTVQTSVKLSGDVEQCPSVGLKLRSNVTLDCAGHDVVGAGYNKASVGVQLSSISGARVTRCKVHGFASAVRIRGGKENVLSDSDLFDSKYGIELAGATRNNVLEGNLVRENRDEGIHVGTGAVENQILANELVRNRTENLYLLNANENTVTGNSLSRSGKAAMYVKHSHDNTFTDNSVRDTKVDVVGSSSGNLFLDNDLRDAKFVFEGYRESSSNGTVTWTLPYDNEVQGGSVTHVDTCFVLAGAHDTTVIDVEIHDCAPTLLLPMGGVAATHNSFQFKGQR
jgi:parallel beta-helix repeat protein